MDDGILFPVIVTQGSCFIFIAVDDCYCFRFPSLLLTDGAVTGGIGAYIGIEEVDETNSDILEDDLGVVEWKNEGKKSLLLMSMSSTINSLSRNMSSSNAEDNEIETVPESIEPDDDDLFVVRFKLSW